MSRKVAKKSETIQIKAGALLLFYQKMVPQRYLSELERRYRPQSRRGIYQPWLVLWLMIVQRINLNKHALSGAVSQAKALLGDQLSVDTSGYSKARQRLPSGFVREVVEHIVSKLFTQFPSGRQSQQKVFILDGTTVSLEHTQSLRSFYRLMHFKGRRTSYWPKLLMVCAHELQTGIALRPVLGRLLGSKAESEPALARKLFKQIPQGSLLLADRCYGIGSFAVAGKKAGYDLLLRLTKIRAEALRGGTLSKRTKRIACSLQGVQGHLVTIKLPPSAGKKAHSKFLYLFTTTEMTPQQCLELYLQRWSIETDIRSLKITLGLHRSTAKSPAMVRKELYMGVAAFSLIRFAMAQAAYSVYGNNAPRSLSVSRCLDLILDSTLIELQRLFPSLARCRIPSRRKKRTEQPRKKRPRRENYPPLHGQRTQDFAL